MDGKNYICILRVFFSLTALRCHYGGVLSLMLSSIFAMQAQRVQFQVHEGIMDFIHGGGEMVERLFLPQQGLLLGVYRGKAIVTECSKAPGSVIGHVDLPDALLPVLREYLEAQRTIKRVLEPYLPES